MTWIMQIICTVCFFKRVVANKSYISKKFQCRKAPGWLRKFFHFGTENWEEQLKKENTLYMYEDNAYHADMLPITCQFRNCYVPQPIF